MKFAALLTVFASALVVRAADANTLDVWAPPITFPTAGVNLDYGQTYNFTWYRSSLTLFIHRLTINRDASSPPPQITNNVAAIYLRQNGRTLPSRLILRIPCLPRY